MYQRLALTFIFTFSFFSSLYSQVDPEAIGYYNDALRFSSFGPYGTARFQAMGGVNAALGGDLSSLAGNPAGLGFYNRSEASISTAFGFSGTTSTFSMDNSVNNENRDYFSFPNLGVVFNMKNNNEGSPYRGGTFGIGLTRMSNFQNRFYYSGMNTKNSMTDFFTDLANGTPSTDLDAEYEDLQTIKGLAYWTFLINPDDLDNTKYYTFNQGDPSKQEETVFTRGAINQWNFSYGGNFNDRIYLGASLGLPQVRYISDKSYKETVQGNDTLDYFRFNESLKVKGGGINFKVGTIVKAADWIRIGLSVQTPTFYSLNEQFDYYIKAVYKDVDVNTSGGTFHLNQEEESTTPGIYKYNLTTPFRASAGISLFAGKAGFIAADIEYVPYNRAQLRESATYATANNSTFEGDNKTIKNLYKPVVNMNIGAELRKDIYRFRGGFSMQKDPYNIGDIDRKVVNISGGAGVRLDDYYIDLAIVNSHFNSLYQSYTLNSGQQAVINVKNRTTNVVITAGVIF